MMMVTLTVDMEVALEEVVITEDEEVRNFYFFQTGKVMWLCSLQQTISCVL